MKFAMKYLIPTLLLASMAGVSAHADDNIANCEIVVQRSIEADAADKSAQIATFMPAGDFIFSVFGAQHHMSEVDGKPIRAVMCKRASVIPSEFDLKIIRTGIPFYLSPDFDAKDSPFLGVSKTDNGYVYDYVGPDLTEDDLALLKIRMKALNKNED